MRTLLLADDSVTTQRVIALTFADDEFRVVTVSDGQQAIEQMAAARPDIVLAGTTLPRTNGYELAEYMRGAEGLGSVPVLLLSGAFESVDVARLKSSGARGVLEKPLEPTTVISRVRELLGLKSARPTPPSGRLVTSPDTPADRKAPPPRQLPSAPPAPAARRTPVSSWDELREESGLEPDARSVEGGTQGSGREDYLDTLDAAFDSLDRHLDGRHAAAKVHHRNPSPPLGQASGAPDPRSPGRRPTPRADGAAPNPIFEVDHEWFAHDRTAPDAAAGRDLGADAHEAMPARPETAHEHESVFEVDHEWFAEDDKAREALRAQQRELAAEMGIHDVELPHAEPTPDKPAPAAGLDFDFGIDDRRSQAPSKPGPVPGSPFAPPSPGPTRVQMPAPSSPVDRAPAPLQVPAALPQLAPLPAPEAPQAPLAPAPMAHVLPGPVGSVADDFAALLAFETGEQVYEEAPAPSVAAAPPSEPVVVPAAAPEITDAMLDQIAARVGDRLNSGTFGADLRDAMMAAARDTVRTVVSETAERLVRDEIARVKAAAERDTP